MSISPPPIKRRRFDNASENREDVVQADAISRQQTAESQLTVYSWNVNGIDALLQHPISHFLQPKAESPRKPRGVTGRKQLSPLQVVLARHGWPELYFLQEVKIKSDDAKIIRSVRQAVASDDAAVPAYQVSFCLPSDRPNARGIGAKVYGVCTLIRKDFAGDHVETTEEVEWDKEGRFLVTKVKAVPGRPRLAIFNVYMVNGTDLPWKDKSSGEVLGVRHDRKLQVHALLQRECRRLHEEGFAVIIAGDINIARGELDGHPNLRTFPTQHIINRADFEHRFLSGSGISGEPSLGMIDTFRHLNDKKTGYSYYGRSMPFGASCDRVDMVLTSRTISERCTAAGMHETELDRGSSDHVPIYARFTFNTG